MRYYRPYLVLLGCFQLIVAPVVYIVALPFITAVEIFFVPAIACAVLGWILTLAADLHSPPNILVQGIRALLLSGLILLLAALDWTQRTASWWLPIHLTILLLPVTPLIAMMLLHRRTIIAGYRSVNQERRLKQ